MPLGQRQINDQTRVEAVEFHDEFGSTDMSIVGVGQLELHPGLRAAQVMVEENYAPVLIGKDDVLDIVKGSS